MIYLSLVFGLLLCAISAASLLLFKIHWLKDKTHYLLALAAGTLLADAIFHLLPHALKHLTFDFSLGIVFLLAILVSFTLESWLRWRECCQTDKKNLKTLSVMNLFGDSWCNFVDGLSLAAAFSASPAAGIATGISIFLHEIPQEISDFATLLHAGFSQKKAFLANLAISTLSLFGILLGWLILGQISWLEPYLLVFSAGTLVYLSLSILIPEVHTFHKRGFNWLVYLLFLLGIIFIASLSLLEGQHHLETEHKHTVKEAPWHQDHKDSQTQKINPHKKEKQDHLESKKEDPHEHKEDSHEH